ncbi:putative pentatricopeptide repeat-containing protein At3g16710, mitochondrial [Selaginella moellendorffii]|uniref:putative pentatricopeptide repeat-containing protein At3g16710, mitochondrial n=1 Tax=Selaginella moellendorffii TaxID=88036 RepID=UPI000D1CEBD6|nr:putative pentatricopeptide repeat-containing protein At3g16710, mitochondrial [Selaginella moellendorffii]|eukprot:XP_024522487.1 putative pentatricopeptide repeat-containing protein At3g16710, mitochondrial [Selaginella moellendorffii]
MFVRRQCGVFHRQWRCMHSCNAGAGALSDTREGHNSGIVGESFAKVTSFLNTKELALDFFSWAALRQPQCLEDERFWCLPDLRMLLEESYGRKSEPHCFASLQNGFELRIAVWEGDASTAFRVLRGEASAMLKRMSIQLDKPAVTSFTTITENICKAGKFHKGYWLLNHLLCSGKQDMGISIVKCLLTIFRLVKALEQFSLMIDTGCTFDREASRLVINKMCKANKVDDAMKVLKVANKLHGPDMVSFNTVVRGLAASDRIQEAMDFFGREGITPSSSTYNIIIEVFLEQNRLNEAFDIYQEAVDNGQVRSIGSALAMLFQGLVWGHRFREALELLETYVDIGGVPTAAMNADIVLCLCHVGKLDEALELFHSLVSDGCGLPADLLVRELSKAGRAEECLKVVKLMLDRQQLRERHLVNITIDSLCKSDMIDKAESWFQELKDFRGLVNTVSYNILINAFCKTKRIDEAIQLFGEMKAPGCAPSTSTYNTLIGGLCRVERLGEAQQFYERLLSSGAGASFITYNILVDGFCKADRVPEAVELLNELVARGGVVTSAPYNCIIDTLFKKGKTQEAELFFNRMEKDGVRPQEVTFTVLIDGLCKANRVARAKEIFFSYLESGGSPSVVICSCLMDGFCKYGGVDEAWRIFELMTNRGCTPNDVSCNILINGLCKAKRLSQAREVFEEVVKRQAKPDVVTYSTFMDGLCRAHRVDQARQVLCMLVDKGGTPDVVMYTALISGLCSLGRLDEARKVFEVDMRAAGCAPNNFTCNVLVNGFGLAGRLDEARELFQRFVERGVQPDCRTFSAMANNTAKTEGWDIYSWNEWITGKWD